MLDPCSCSWLNRNRSCQLLKRAAQCCRFSSLFSRRFSSPRQQSSTPVRFFFFVSICRYRQTNLQSPAFRLESELLSRRSSSNFANFGIARLKFSGCQVRTKFAQSRQPDEPYGYGTLTTFTSEMPTAPEVVLLMATN